MSLQEEVFKDKNWQVLCQDKTPEEVSKLIKILDEHNKKEKKEDYQSYMISLPIKREPTYNIRNRLTLEWVD